MSYENIDEKIDDEVDFRLGDDYSIQHDNDAGFNKPDNAVYLRSFIRYSDSVPNSFGDGVRYTLHGTLEFQVIGILGEGKAAVNVAVTAIIAAFEYLRLVVEDAEGSIVRFQNPLPTPVGRNDGTYQTNVAIRFWVDLVATS